MVDWKKLRDVNRRGLLIERVDGRFSFTRTGYRFDRWLVRVVLGVSLLILFVVFFVGLSRGVGLNELYFHCPSAEEALLLGQTMLVGGCPNPYFHACDDAVCLPIVEKESFFPGESFGVPPDEGFVSLAYYAVWAALGVFLGGLVVNHLLYNRGLSPIDLEDGE